MENHRGRQETAPLGLARLSLGGSRPLLVSPLLGARSVLALTPIGEGAPSFLVPPFRLCVNRHRLQWTPVSSVAEPGTRRLPAERGWCRLAPSASRCRRPRQRSVSSSGSQKQSPCLAALQTNPKRTSTGVVRVVQDAKRACHLFVCGACRTMKIQVTRTKRRSSLATTKWSASGSWRTR